VTRRHIHMLAVSMLHLEKVCACVHFDGAVCEKDKKIERIKIAGARPVLGPQINYKS